MIITTQQARQRFTTIPLSLRDVMFSTQIDQILDDIAQQYHLDDIKNDAVGKIAGWVLLGFIHPEDVSREIQQTLNLPSQLAEEISKSLNVKIFSSLSDDLSKAYAPVPASDEASTQPVPVGPTIISQNFSVQPNTPLAPVRPKAAAAPAAKPPTVTSQSMPGALSSTLTQLNKNVAAPAPKPVQQVGAQSGATKPGTANTNTSDKGWSRQTGQDPVVKLGVITAGVPAPRPSGAPTATQAKAPTTATATTQPATPKGMSEFERLDLQKRGVLSSSAASSPIPRTPVTTTPPTSSTVPTAPIPTAKPQMPMPAPVMLHQVDAPTGDKRIQSFQVNAGMQNQMGRMPNQVPMPNRAAVLEFGKDAPTPGSAPRAPMPARPAGQTPPPITSNGPRNITEITSSATASTPQPAQPPKPPTPPGAAATTGATPPTPNKVVVKDYR